MTDFQRNRASADVVCRLVMIGNIDSLRKNEIISTHLSHDDSMDLNFLMKVVQNSQRWTRLVYSLFLISFLTG